MQRRHTRALWQALHRPVLWVLLALDLKGEGVCVVGLDLTGEGVCVVGSRDAVYGIYE